MLVGGIGDSFSHIQDFYLREMLILYSLGTNTVGSVLIPKSKMFAPYFCEFSAFQLNTTQ